MYHIRISVEINSTCCSTHIKLLGEIGNKIDSKSNAVYGIACSKHLHSAMYFVHNTHQAILILIYLIYSKLMKGYFIHGSWINDRRDGKSGMLS